MLNSKSTQSDMKARTAVVPDGRYVYCVAETGETAVLGSIGIGESRVYTVPYGDLCAVVHDCRPQPYQSPDRAVVEKWVLKHQEVVDTAWGRWGTVLPLSFDTIVKPGPEQTAEQSVVAWLKDEYESLKGRMEKLRGKAEYGVQVLWDPRVIAQQVAQTSREIAELDAEIRAMPRGLAYMHRQRLEKLLKTAMEARADDLFRDSFRRIKPHTDDVHVEKSKAAEPGLQMVVNLSCLVEKEKCTELGRELDRINQTEGLCVRFTGPWPPYSFVGNA